MCETRDAVRCGAVRCGVMCTHAPLKAAGGVRVAGARYRSRFSRRVRAGRAARARRTSRDVRRYSSRLVFDRLADWSVACSLARSLACLDGWLAAAALITRRRLPRKHYVSRACYLHGVARDPTGRGRAHPTEENTRAPCLADDSASVLASAAFSRFVSARLRFSRILPLPCLAVLFSLSLSLCLSFPVCLCLGRTLLPSPPRRELALSLSFSVV